MVHVHKYVRKLHVGIFLRKMDEKIFLLTFVYLYIYKWNVSAQRCFTGPFTAFELKIKKKKFVVMLQSFKRFTEWTWSRCFLFLFEEG